METITRSIEFELMNTRSFVSQSNNDGVVSAIGDCVPRPSVPTLEICEMDWSYDKGLYPVNIDVPKLQKELLDKALSHFEWFHADKRWEDEKSLVEKLSPCLIRDAPIFARNPPKSAISGHLFKDFDFDVWQHDPNFYVIKGYFVCEFCLTHDMQTKERRRHLHLSSQNQRCCDPGPFDVPLALFSFPPRFDITKYGNPDQSSLGLENLRALASQPYYQTETENNPHLDENGNIIDDDLESIGGDPYFGDDVMDYLCDVEPLHVIVKHVLPLDSEDEEDIVDESYYSLENSNNNNNNNDESFRQIHSANESGFNSSFSNVTDAHDANEPEESEPEESESEENESEDSESDDSDSDDNESDDSESVYSDDGDYQWFIDDNHYYLYHNQMFIDEFYVDAEENDYAPVPIYYAQPYILDDTIDAIVPQNQIVIDEQEEEEIDPIEIDINDDDDDDIPAYVPIDDAILDFINVPGLYNNQNQQVYWLGTRREYTGFIIAAVYYNDININNGQNQFIFHMNENYQENYEQQPQQQQQEEQPQQEEHHLVNDYEIQDGAPIEEPYNYPIVPFVEPYNYPIVPFVEPEVVTPPPPPPSPQFGFITSFVTSLAIYRRLFNTFHGFFGRLFERLFGRFFRRNN